MLDIVALCTLERAGISSSAELTVIVDADNEPVMTGNFKPTWKSQEQHEVPEWFRDAKFGIASRSANRRPATGAPATCTSRAGPRTDRTWSTTATLRNSA